MTKQRVRSLCSQSPHDEKEARTPVLVLCSLNARPKRMGWVAWSSSCSRNAHDRNVLVRRAQSRIDQATLENEVGETGTEPDDLLCSRNARPPKALVGRAQWRISQSPFLKKIIGERRVIDKGKWPLMHVD